MNKHDGSLGLDREMGMLDKERLRGEMGKAGQSPSTEMEP